MVDYQRSIRQICLSPYIETALGLAFVGMTGTKADRCHCSSSAWKTICNCLMPAFVLQEFSAIHSSDAASAFSVARVRWPRTGLSLNRAEGRLGHPASIPRGIMSRSPEALAFGARRHFIPASLSLPLCGCLLDRSRDCSRSRVPPRFPRRRYADAPAAASFSCLRFAPARSHLSPVGERNWRLDAAIIIEPHVPFGPRVRFRRAESSPTLCSINISYSLKWIVYDTNRLTS